MKCANRLSHAEVLFPVFFKTTIFTFGNHHYFRLQLCFKLHNFTE